jgi:TonB-like protein
LSENIEVDAKIYSSRDADVAPPVAILPQQLGAVPPTQRERLLIEVVLDEYGNVESAKTNEVPQSLGDAELVTMSLHAVKSWRFQPAMRNGRPVKYRQMIPVALR